MTEGMGTRRVLSSRRIWIARGIAVLADLLQIVIFPAMMEGFASPANVVLDVVVAGLMIVLVGWHIAFVPSFVVEMLPIADLAPTWTIAILFVTRGKRLKELPSEPQTP